jgi:hypothetical protein
MGHAEAACSAELIDRIGAWVQRAVTAQFAEVAAGTSQQDSTQPESANPTPNAAA